MKHLFAALAALVALAGPALARAETAQDQAHIADIEAKVKLLGSDAVEPLAQRMAALKVPGVSIAFFEDGKIRWTRTYGVADTTTKAPVTPDTLFQAASMSKAIAAAGALKLVEQGKLSLDADVNTRLKAWKVPDSPFTATDKVTLRGLLSHTAGLNVHGFPGYEAGEPVPTLVQILDGQPPANTPAIRSEARPGEKWSYSGGGYTVAQLMMTEAAGEAYPALLERLVLKPAGMSRSTLVQPLPERMRAQAASGNYASGKPVPGLYHTYPEYAAAGLWTTPSDYARFAMAIQDAYAGRSSRLMSQASARLMATPVMSGYGLGVESHLRGGRPEIEHGGSNEGFQCYFLAFLDGSRQGVVIMTNSDAGYRLNQELLGAVARSYGWGEPAKP